MFFPVRHGTVAVPGLQIGMRCDLHVHTRHSGMCGVPLLERVCRESYNDPQAVYEKLKRLGMDLVTVTDHDSIDAAEALRSRPDFFLSEEVTCRLPSRHRIARGRVRHHRARPRGDARAGATDFESLTAYLDERGLFFSANHVFSSLTGRRALADFELFATASSPPSKPATATCWRAPTRAPRCWPIRSARAEVGGSDAHAMASVGCAYTVVPRARTSTNIWKACAAAAGACAARPAASGSSPATCSPSAATWCGKTHGRCRLRPLALRCRPVILGNYVIENVFARWWMARYRRSRTLGAEACAAAPSRGGGGCHDASRKPC